MTDNEIKTVLSQTMASLLEQAAFIFTEAVDDEPAWPGQVLEAELQITGATSRRLVLVVTRPLAYTLAAELLGLEIDDPTIADKAADAVCEILNMSAGMIVDADQDEGHRTDIGIPAIRTVEAGNRRSVKENLKIKTWQMTEDGEPLELSIGPCEV